MTKRADKRLEMQRKQQNEETKKTEVSATVEHVHHISSDDITEHHSPFILKIAKWYAKNLLKLEIIPIILFILAISQIGFQMYTHHGDFLNKDISLKGGLTLTIATKSDVNLDELAHFLLSKGYVVNVRSIESSGKTVAVLVEADLDFTDKSKTDGLISALSERFDMSEGSYSLEGLGSSIGDSFFRQTIIALLISFVIMSIVVVISFRTFIPCVAILVAAVSDMIMTVATINLLGVKVSLAGIAALIMLIGYSVDTDILLTTRVLRRHEGTIMDRIVSSTKTGLLTSGTTMVISFIGMFISSSEVIRQIMLILFIGMIYDQINTWIQNAGILKRYAEKVEKKSTSIVN